MANVNVGLQVIPKTNEKDSYRIVDKVIELVANAGVKYEVGAMETVMEGPLDQLLEIVKQAQEVCINEGASEVISNVKIHYRPEGVTIDEKVTKYR